jgi:recombination protein RecA
MAVQTEVIDKSGAWYSFDKERIGQGRENAKNFLKENPDVSARILEKFLDALGLAEKETEEPEAVLAHREKDIKK